VTIPDSVSKIKSNAFYNCISITEIEIPSKVNEIETNAFSGCSGLKYIRLPKAISKISTGAFMNCKSIEYIILPKSVLSIDTYAFSGCDSLKKVYYYSTQADYKKISIAIWNEALNDATVYYYSKTDPADGGNYWYDMPIEW